MVMRGGDWRYSHQGRRRRGALTTRGRRCLLARRGDTSRSGPRGCQRPLGRETGVAWRLEPPTYTFGVRGFKRSFSSRISADTMSSNREVERHHSDVTSDVKLWIG
ncbi:hypothetical protein R5R35_011754 [Gryllus longicercus]|uniref:Uncharacterized protein n=1 Tax=Gryllus longicercus TaxID=2509291 RepID=A0AAN9V5R4_9ORTH